MLPAAPPMLTDPDPSCPGHDPETAAEVREALVALRAKLESVRDVLDLLAERAEETPGPLG